MLQLNWSLNLTNPRSHFAVNRACLEAGKHVYSEKPLAMTTSEAQLSRRPGRASSGFSSAQRRAACLSDAAQTLWRAVREGAAGTVRVGLRDV